MEKFNYVKQLVNDETFLKDVQKFHNGNSAAGTRVRKQLANIKRACQAMRNEVQEIRTQRKIA